MVPLLDTPVQTNAIPSFGWHSHRGVDSIMRFSSEVIVTGLHYIQRWFSHSDHLTYVKDDLLETALST